MTSLPSLSSSVIWVEDYTNSEIFSICKTKIYTLDGFAAHKHLAVKALMTADKKEPGEFFFT